MTLGTVLRTNKRVKCKFASLILYRKRPFVFILFYFSMETHISHVRGNENLHICKDGGGLASRPNSKPRPLNENCRFLSLR